MTPRRLRVSLYSLSMITFIIGAGITAAVLILPNYPGDADPGTPLPAAMQSRDPKTSRHVAMGIVNFEPVWGKRLRGLQATPLENSTKVARQAKPSLEAIAVVTKFDGELLGTVVDSKPTLSRAWLATKQHKRFVKIGDELTDVPGNPKVKQIAPGQIQLDYGQQPVWIKLNRTAFDDPTESNPPSESHDEKLIAT